jgi:chaperonin GroES
MLVTTPDSDGRSAAPDTTPRPDGSVPVKLLHDRLLVKVDTGEGERRSGGGILIPATAQVGKKLAWARVVALGPNVRTIQIGDQVLFEPEDRGEVELHGAAYILLRERDVHAVASSRVPDTAAGLYL